MVGKIVLYYQAFVQAIGAVECMTSDMMTRQRRPQRNSVHSKHLDSLLLCIVMSYNSPTRGGTPGESGRSVCRKQQTDEASKQVRQAASHGYMYARRDGRHKASL